MLSTGCAMSAEGCTDGTLQSTPRCCGRDKVGASVATLTGVWRYRVSAGTGWPVKTGYKC